MRDKEIDEGRIFAVAGYWAIFCILPLFFKKDNKFAVYHGKQGLVLFIFLAAGFLFNIAPFGRVVLRTVIIIYILLLLLGTIYALCGRYGKMPIISGIAKNITL